MEYIVTDHYRLGKCIADTADKLNRKIMVVASGDLSHKQVTTLIIPGKNDSVVESIYHLAEKARKNLKFVYEGNC